MGNEEMPANIEAYEQEVDDAEYDEVDDDDDDDDDFDSADQGDDDNEGGDDDEDYADGASRSQRKRARKKPLRQRARGGGSAHALRAEHGGDAIGHQAGVAPEGYYRTTLCCAKYARKHWSLYDVLTVRLCGSIDGEGALDSEDAYEPKSSEDEEEDDSDIERQVRSLETTPCPC